MSRSRKKPERQEFRIVRPWPSTPAGQAEHVDVAVMACGSRKDLATFLRSVAQALEMGSVSGKAGIASRVQGNWIST